MMAMTMTILITRVEAAAGNRTGMPAASDRNGAGQ